ncbi:MAG: pyruvate formate-lyase-activating protein [Butyrivibrio sp.]|nr:pyruvate formate-lyase-activating protein [Butyrivibrio sp.]
MVKGAIHSIETFGSVDGPGIRFIVFLKGCKLRCKYCHNADTWDPNSEDMRTPDELLDFAERYRSYWGTEGGITVSGGEPLLQIDFLTELFKKAKERGINTCIDTALQPFTREEPFFSKFNELLKYTDLMLVDIKHIDRDEHIELTGLPNDNIIDGMKYLSEMGQPIWIRHVLVPGITDNDEYLKKTRSFIETLSNVEKIEVLPYHSMGQHKFETLGIPYKLDGVKSPTKDRVDNAMNILNGK